MGGEQKKKKRKERMNEHAVFNVDRDEKGEEEKKISHELRDRPKKDGSTWRKRKKGQHHQLVFSCGRGLKEKGKIGGYHVLIRLLPTLR